VISAMLEWRERHGRGDNSERRPTGPYDRGSRTT
jgi:hypothetical protein